MADVVETPFDLADFVAVVPPICGREVYGYGQMLEEIEHARTVDVREVVAVLTASGKTFDAFLADVVGAALAKSNAALS